jgi:hypothetical protein
MDNKQTFKEIINQYVRLIQHKKNSEQMIKLKESTPTEYKQQLDNFVPEFKNEYPFLYRMIISDNDLSILDTFLDNIVDIDDGKKTLNEVRNDLGHMLHDKYIGK